MYSHLFLLVVLITVVLSFPSQILKEQKCFTIDWKNNDFFKNEEPFRYVVGCVHYFRSSNEYWYDRLIKMSAAGVNALQTYIEWASHEPRKGEYNFKGDLNITKYYETAMEADLLIVLRIGSYTCICAKRDMISLILIISVVWFGENCSALYIHIIQHILIFSLVHYEKFSLQTHHKLSNTMKLELDWFFIQQN